MQLNLRLVGLTNSKAGNLLNPKAEKRLVIKNENSRTIDNYQQ